MGIGYLCRKADEVGVVTVIIPDRRSNQIHQDFSLLLPEVAKTVLSDYSAAEDTVTTSRLFVSGSCYSMAAYVTGKARVELYVTFKKGPYPATVRFDGWRVYTADYRVHLGNFNCF